MLHIILLILKILGLLILGILGLIVLAHCRRSSRSCRVQPGGIGERYAGEPSGKAEISLAFPPDIRGDGVLRTAGLPGGCVPGGKSSEAAWKRMRT